MKKIYLLTPKRGGQPKAYLSKAALYADNTPAELGISHFTLQDVDFEQENYENDKVKIELLIARAKSEIEAEKEKFL